MKGSDPIGGLTPIGEMGVIERIRRRVPPRSPSVLVGIGDDAAVLRPPPRGSRLLLTCDMLVEGTHFTPPHVGRGAGFTRDATPAAAIGWKALACNISDVAAMGGRPLWAVVSLGLPPSSPVSFVDGFFQGLLRCAKRFGVALVGGDTVRAPQVIVDVAMAGAVEPRHLVRRSGARVGDAVYVTGRLGGSLRSGRHATFLPRLREARRLVTHFRVHAMMDLSDGLASDAWQLARESRVTIRIDEAAVPVHPDARDCRIRTCPCRRWRGPSTVYHALMDGEDFELLFTVSGTQAARVPRRLGPCPITRIGSVVARGIGVELVRLDGRIAPLVPLGFRHY